MAAGFFLTYRRRAVDGSINYSAAGFESVTPDRLMRVRVTAKRHTYAVAVSAGTMSGESGSVLRPRSAGAEPGLQRVFHLRMVFLVAFFGPALVVLLVRRAARHGEYPTVERLVTSIDWVAWRTTSATELHTDPPTKSFPDHIVQRKMTASLEERRSSRDDIIRQHRGAGTPHRRARIRIPTYNWRECRDELDIARDGAAARHSWRLERACVCCMTSQDRVGIRVLSSPAAAPRENAAIASMHPVIGYRCSRACIS